MSNRYAARTARTRIAPVDIFAIAVLTFPHNDEISARKPSHFGTVVA
jgi:hypothetical protein